MSKIFALWGRILRTRPDVYVQLLLTIVAAALIMGVLAISAIARPGQSSGGPFLLAIVAFLAVLSFGYGAALGALGEATRGEPRSPFWQRGYHLWGRTLGLFAVDFLIGIVLVIVMLLIASATGMLSGFSQLASLGGAPSLTAVYRVFGAFMVIIFILALAVGPWLQAAQAIIYVDQVPVLLAFSKAFAEGYGRGRLGQWLIVMLIAVVLDLASALIQFPLGKTGQALGILLSPAVLWLATALAFATYRTHEGGAETEELH